VGMGGSRKRGGGSTGAAHQLVGPDVWRAHGDGDGRLVLGDGEDWRDHRAGRVRQQKHGDGREHRRQAALRGRGERRGEGAVRRLEARPTQKYDSGTAARSAHLRTAPRADGPGPRGARAARLAAHPAARRVRAAPGAFPSLPPCVLPAPQGPLQLVCCARPGVVTSPTTAPTCIGMDAAAAADAGAAAPGGEQLTADKLLEAIKTIKAENPDFGIKRVWTTLKEGQGLEVSEKRVKKIMQENGLTEGGAGGAAEPAAEGGELTARSRRRRRRTRPPSTRGATRCWQTLRTWSRA